MKTFFSTLFLLPTISFAGNQAYDHAKFLQRRDDQIKLLERLDINNADKLSDELGKNGLVNLSAAGVANEAPLVHLIKNDADIDKIKILLNNGADIEARDAGGFTPLMNAVKNYADFARVDKDLSKRLLPVIDLLLQKGANPYSMANYREYAIDNVKDKDLWERFKPLCQIDGKWMFPVDKVLNSAAYIGDVEMVRKIWQQATTIDRSCNPEFDFIDFNQALRSAVIGENMQIVDFLLDKGINPNAPDNSGGTALANYMLLGPLNPKNFPEMVEKLLDAGADVNVGDLEYPKRPLLGLIFWRGRSKDFINDELFRRILDATVDLNVADDFGITPLMAVESIERCRMMLAKGAELEALDKDGNNVLMNRVDSSRDLFELLVNSGAKVNHKNSNGQTALMKLCADGPFDAEEKIQMLIKHGADVNLLDNNGMSALDYAYLANEPKLIDLLKEKAVKAKNSSRLFFAVWNKDAEAALNILKDGVDFGSIPEAHGQSLTMLAISNIENILDTQKLMKAFVTAGLDINQANKEGKTTLHWFVCAYEQDMLKATGTDGRYFSILKMLLDLGANPKLPRRPVFDHVGKVVASPESVLDYCKARGYSKIINVLESNPSGAKVHE